MTYSSTLKKCDEVKIYRKHRKVLLSWQVVKDWMTLIIMSVLVCSKIEIKMGDVL